MKFTINQREFIYGLNKVRPALATKNTLPVIKHIYCESTEEGLILQATDMEINIEVKVDCKVTESGKVILNRDIINIINVLPNEEVNVEIDKNYKAKITCQKSKFTVNCFDAEEYPTLPKLIERESSTVKTADLINYFTKVKFAASSKNEFKPELTGICIDSNYFVATDVYVLAITKTDISIDKPIIIPCSAIDKINFKGKETKITIAESFVRFESGNEKITTRIIEGAYPRWRQLTSSEGSTLVKIDVEQFRQALKRVGTIAKQGAEGIKLTISKDTLSIDAGIDDRIHKDLGKAHEEVEIELTGPEQTLVININYLTNVLKVWEDEVFTFEIKDNKNPLVARNKDSQYIIMPIRFREVEKN